MSFTARQVRAMGYCARKYDKRLSAIHAYPQVFFVDKSSGTVMKIHIDDVTRIYDDGRKEDAKERARTKRLETAS